MERQCRFCLETHGEMVAPCDCKGSSQWVHVSCLSTWRLTNRRARKRCNVCKAVWTVPAPKIEEVLFLRTVHTAARYRQVPCPNPEAFRALMATGSVIAQTDERATQENSLTVPGDVGGTRQRRNAFTTTGPMASLVAAVLEARALRHWHKGVFLVLYVGSGAGADGSDSVVAANLTRPAPTAFDEDDSPAEAPQPRRLEWLRSAARALRGGDAQPPPPAAEPEDSSSDSDDERYRERYVRRARQGLRSFEALGIPCYRFSGGPVHRDKPVALLLYEGEVPEEDLGDVEPWQGDGINGIVGTPETLVNLVPRLRETATNLRILCFRGVAVWSTDQLVSEIARGSWALARALPDDLTNPSLLANQTQHQLWNAVLHGSRTVLSVPTPTAPPPDDPPPPPPPVAALDELTPP